MLRVGFTGTREGMTPPQKQGLHFLIFGLRLDEFYHGDCIGADEQAHELVLKHGVWIKIWPPKDEKYRAFCHTKFDYEKVVVNDPKEYLIRNQFIVNNSNLMIATPKQATEQQRSGTWSTVRYAEHWQVPVLIILPNGKVEVR